MTHKNSYGAHRVVRDGEIIPISQDMICWRCVQGKCDRQHVKTIATAAEPITSEERLKRAINALMGARARRRREARRELV